MAPPRRPCSAISRKPRDVGDVRVEPAAWTSLAATDKFESFKSVYPLLMFYIVIVQTLLTVDRMKTFVGWWMSLQGHPPEAFGRKMVTRAFETLVDIGYA